MPNQYAQIRKNFKAIDTERDLKMLWTRERFEDRAASIEALRVYEIAIRVEGWDKIKNWARAYLEKDRILHAQLVELSIRALEQKDVPFLEEITDKLLGRSPPNYFKFWFTLFQTRHSHAGEKAFIKQLGALSDYRVVKYRRWLRKIMRKLRMRCKTDREKAIGAIVFAMYKEYDAKAYPSEDFTAYIKAHNAARTREKTKQGKPVSARRQTETFANAAVKLGIWSVTEGIRTSTKLPRTLHYLSAMAPKMTDQELLRSLRAFDANLKTADHKKASEAVVQCAEYLTGRLSKMDRTIEEWAKIYPYLQSPLLIRVIEDLLEPKLDKAIGTIQAALPYTLIPIVPATLSARAYRTAMLLGYLLGRATDDSTTFLINEHAQVSALAKTTKLLPYGYGVQPKAHRWQAEPDRPHRALFHLIRATFPTAAARKDSVAAPFDSLLIALRAHLHKRTVIYDAVSAHDIPVVFMGGELDPNGTKALEEHLSFFPATMMLKLESDWVRPLKTDGRFCSTVPCDVITAITSISAMRDQLSALSEAFDPAPLSKEIRHLRLLPPPPVAHIAQGPY